jgi:hypothetical protein
MVTRPTIGRFRQQWRHLAPEKTGKWDYTVSFAWQGRSAGEKGEALKPFDE